MQPILIILAVMFISFTVACYPVNQAEPTENHQDKPRAAEQARGSVTSKDDKNPDFEQPEWVKAFTKDPRVLAYRWYRGNKCPSGKYSDRDDLYIFDKEEVLSQIEIQTREPGEKIGTAGFHSTEGHICIALSEKIHPANYTALHELAHAIVYVEHGLTGHSKIYERKLLELIRLFDKAWCITGDQRLIEFIDRHIGNPHKSGRRPTTRTPDEQAVYDACLDRKYEVTYVMLPTAQPTPTPKLDLPNVNNRFLEIRYDASKTANNDQDPVRGLNCAGGSGPMTKWSRTLDIRPENALILDAEGKPVQITQLRFELVHPGRKYTDDECPSDQYYATAEFEPLIPWEPANLTGYIAEFRTEEGQLIAMTPADGGIRITLDGDSQPEDLYARPARLLIYDPGSHRPTPTPRPLKRPEDKMVEFTVNPQEWSSHYKGSINHGRRYWTETVRKSPDLSDRRIQITDSNGATWTVKSIFSVEATDRSSGPDIADFSIYMVSESRAQAAFNGYEMMIIREDTPKTPTAGRWDPVEDRVPIGQAIMKGRTIGVPKGVLKIRIWDTNEPSLNPAGREPTG